MSYRQAKFCLDVNKIRWSLLEGVITRKGQEDGPHDGQELSIEQVAAVEPTTVKRVQRSRLGWPVTYFAIALLLLATWIATFLWLLSVPFFGLGLLCLVWGAKRIPPQTEVLEAHRIVAAVANPEDWVVVGSISEVKGFIEGVRIELQEKAKGAQQTVKH